MPAKWIIKSHSRVKLPNGELALDTHAGTVKTFSLLDT